MTLICGNVTLFCGSLVSTCTEIAKFEGDVLRSTRSNQSHFIEFEFKTSVGRPAEVFLPLWVSADGSTKVYLNDQFISTFKLVSSNDETPIINCIELDVTKWSESKETARLRLGISYSGQSGMATIPVDPSHATLKPRLVQKWEWRHAMQVLLFFALTWGSILALLVVGIAHIRALTDTLRFYAVLVTIGAWVLSVLGVPDKGRIPLRPILRRLYGQTRAYRIPLISILSVVFVFSAVGAATVSYCLAIRQYYSMLITKALQGGPKAGEYISRAFILQPSRKEAQVVFETQAYGKRGDSEGYRKVVQTFVKQQDVEDAVLRSSSSINSCCLDKADSSAFNDPLLWYANILPEGDEENDNKLTMKAASLLESREDPEAVTLRLYLQLYLNQGDDNISQSLVTRLQDQLAKYNDTDLVYTHTYQLACDILGGYYVGYCRWDEAIEWYRKELEARRLQSQIWSKRDEPLWSRPPQKLQLYYMFLFYSETTPLPENKKGNAVPLLEWRGEKNQKCIPFKQHFENRLLRSYPSFKDEATWLGGTVIDSKLESYVRENLFNVGWKY